MLVSYIIEGISDRKLSSGQLHSGMRNNTHFRNPWLTDGFNGDFTDQALI